MCNCSGHGTCNFGVLQEGVSLTAPFQLVTCNCETGYEGICLVCLCLCFNCLLTTTVVALYVYVYASIVYLLQQLLPCMFMFMLQLFTYYNSCCPVCLCLCFSCLLSTTVVALYVYVYASVVYLVQQLLPCMFMFMLQ